MVNFIQSHWDKPMRQLSPFAARVSLLWSMSDLYVFEQGREGVSWVSVPRSL